MKSDECEITVILDFTNFSTITAELQILERHFVVSLLPRPFEGLSPSLVPKPVAYEVRIALNEEGVSTHWLQQSLLPQAQEELTA